MFCFVVWLLNHGLIGFNIGGIYIETSPYFIFTFYDVIMKVKTKQRIREYSVAILTK